MYSENDVDRLIAALDGTHATSIEARTLRTLVLLLYGTGLRLGEALHLCLADVDLSRQMLTVRDTTFYKTRWVPIGTHLVQILHEYVVADHTSLSVETRDDTPLFIRRDGGWPTASGVRRAFARLRLKAGVRRNDGARDQPRLHNMRATFAVHHLTTWYQQGADVQRLLSLLSAYLGHASIAATQVYLPISLELLMEASIRLGQLRRAGETVMNDLNVLAAWVKRFLADYLVTVRSVARSTQLSYRDTLARLIRYAANELRTRPDLLKVDDISRDLIN